MFAHAAVAASSEGPLLTLLHPCRSLVPFGAVVDWDEARLSVGEPVLVEARSLRIGGDRFFALDGEGRDLSVRQAPVSTGALVRGLEGLRLPERTRALLGAGGEADLVVGAARRRLTRLLDALTAGEELEQEHWEALVGELSGLGPGSTPTGDDLLAGIAAAGWRLNDRRLWSKNWNRLLAALRTLPRDRTTETAAEMLAHASRGFFPEALLELVMLLGDEQADSPALQRAAERLGTLGAQTGFDMLAGALALASRVSDNNHGETS